MRDGFVGDERRLVREHVIHGNVHPQRLNQVLPFRDLCNGGEMTTAGEETGGGDTPPTKTGTGGRTGGGADGIAAGTPTGGGNDIVRSDSEDAERSSWDKGRCGEAAKAAGDATDAGA